jgi:adenylate kinase family enzyme
VLKINVVGTSGSGKSTFARRLAQRRGIPYVEMDKLFWGAGWRVPDDAEFFPKVAAAIAGDAWVLDGNYTRTVPIKWQRVDMVVWLDYPFATTLYRAVKRALMRAWTKAELWDGTGNRESFRKLIFSKDSIVRWTIQTYRGNRRRYEAAMADPRNAAITFVRLRRPSEAERFLSSS